MTEQTTEEPARDTGRSVAPQEADIAPARRRALARLGLTAAVAYATPTILKINRSARGQIPFPSVPCEDPPPFPPGSPPDCPEGAPGFPGFPAP